MRRNRSKSLSDVRAILLILLTVALFVVSASPAAAAFLVPGGSVAPTPGNIGGTLIDTLISPFAFPGQYTGILTSQVYANDPYSPFSGLTFVYEVRNGPQVDVVAHPLHSVRLFGFGGVATDVAYENGGANAPTTASRLEPNAVKFEYVVPHFEGTDMLIVHTDFQDFHGHNHAINKQGGEAEAEILAPTAVPEPAMLWIFSTLVVGVRSAMRAMKRFHGSSAPLQC